MNWFLTAAFGGIVGFSLGLTGGGGAIFAVPLLVYGLGVAPREAVGTSLASVGATALVGFAGRWRARQVEVRTGLIFAAAGMLGAPVGTWLAGLIPEAVLLVLFAGVMVVVAIRMWQQAAIARITETIPSSLPETFTQKNPPCQRDGKGRLILTSRCAGLIIAVGAATGVLSGMFGVGGGFVIVPALVLFSGMDIRVAIGTSLMVIALVSLSGITSYLVAGRMIDSGITGLFILGGVSGMLLGSRLGRRLSGSTLQRVFAVAIVTVATFVIIKTAAGT